MLWVFLFCYSFSLSCYGLFFLFFFHTVLIIATSTRAKGNRHSCISYYTYKKKKSPKHTHFGRFPCTLNSSLGDHLFPMNFESVPGDSFSRFEFGMQLNRIELLWIEFWSVKIYWVLKPIENYLIYGFNN